MLMMTYPDFATILGNDINKTNISMLAKLGFSRQIERHNFLIKNILLKQILKYPYAGKVLDLGCGDSPFREIILQTATEYVGVDNKITNSINTFVNVAADITKPLQFDDGSFDSVVMFNVLDDIPDPLSLLVESMRVLKKQGGLFMITPFMWKIHDEPFDYYRFSRFGLEYLLKKSGYINIEIKEVGPRFWGCWFLQFNYFTLRFLRPWNKYPFYIIWWMTQIIGMALDRFNFSISNSSTSHYSISAYKP